MSDLCVFTAGNDLALARQSCERVGIRLQEFDGKWSTFSDIKLVRARAFLETRAEEYAMWIDGHDSLVLEGEDEILRRFRALRFPVVVSAEQNCFPDPELAEQYPVARDPRYICAGGWIGRRTSLIDVLRRISLHDSTDHDQRAWTKAFLAGVLPEVQIDYGRKIYASVGDGDEALTSGACVMHWNGRVPGREEFWNAQVELR